MPVKSWVLGCWFGLSLALAQAQCPLPRAQAPKLDPKLFTSQNGPVYDVHHRGDKVYLGGLFSRVGLQTGGLVPINLNDGHPRFPFPQVSIGTVFALAEDGNGGVFLGGNFTYVDDSSRNGIAHVRRDGSISSFFPKQNGTISSLLRVGNRLYLGGQFTQVNGTTVGNLACVDTGTGQLTGPMLPTTDRFVRSMTLFNNLLVFAGDFQIVNSNVPRYSLAAADVNTGQLSTWFPNPNNPVRVVQSHNGWLYAGGDFTNLGGVNCNRLLRFRPNLTADNTWLPTVSGRLNYIGGFGNRLFVGGAIAQIDGQQRPGVALFRIPDATTPPNLLNYQLPITGSVTSIALMDELVVVAGDFSTPSGDIGLAVFDSTAGLSRPLGTNPNPSYPSAIVPLDNQIIWVGGGFSFVKSQTRRNFAAIDINTGFPTNDTLSLDGEVRCFAAKGDSLLVGGRFRRARGIDQYGFTTYDMARSQLMTSLTGVDGEIRSIVWNDSVMVWGGQFSRYISTPLSSFLVNEPVSNIAALNVANWRRSWPLKWSNNRVKLVNTLAAYGQHLYVGGIIDTGAFGPKSSITRFLINRGNIQPWRAAVPDTAFAVLLQGGNQGLRAYFGTNSDLQQLPTNLTKLAVFDVPSKRATSPYFRPGSPFGPGFEIGHSVNVFALVGDHILAGGQFDAVDLRPANGFFSWQAPSNQVWPWTPNFFSSGTIHQIIPTRRGLFIGGNLGSLGLPQHFAFGKFDGDFFIERPVITGSLGSCQDSTQLLRVRSNFPVLWLKDGVPITDLPPGPVDTLRVRSSGYYSARAIGSPCELESAPFYVALLPKQLRLAATAVVFCPGLNATLSAKVNKRTGTIQWFKDNIIIANASDSSLVVTQAGRYHLVYSPDDGCPVSSDSLYIRISPILPKGIVTGAAGFCLGGTTTLTANGVPPGFKIRWNTGDTTASIRVTRPGRFSFFYAISGQCQSFPSDSFAVGLYPDASNIQVMGSLSVCPGAQGLGYKVTGVNFDSLSIIRISNGLLVNASKDSLTINWANARTDTAVIEFVTFNTQRCPGPRFKQFVRIRPTLIPEAPTGDTLICGTEVNGTYLAQTNPGATVNWQVTGGQIVSGQGSRSVVIRWGNMLPRQLRFIEQVSADTICRGESKPLNIKLRALPDPTLTITTPSQPCEGNVFETRYPATIGSSYAWVSKSAGLTLVSANGNIARWVANRSGQFTLAITETNAGGCAGPEKTQAVDVLPAPIVDLRDTATCSNVALRFQYSSFGGIQLLTTWRLNGQIVSTQEEYRFQQSNDLNSPIRQKLSLTVLNPATNCESTDSAIITVQGRPLVTLNTNNGYLCPEVVNTRTYTAVGIRLRSFDWRVTNGQINSQQGNQVTVTWDRTGPWQLGVAATDSFGCESDPVFLQVREAEELNQPNPPCNPADYPLVVTNLLTDNNDSKNERFTVERLRYFKNHELSIYNRWGRQVFRTNDASQELPLSSWPVGTYYVYLSTPEGVAYRGWLELVR